VIDSLREYLEALGTTMKRDLLGLPPTDAHDPRALARVHGAQRFRLGYEVGAVIREYGTLRELLLAVARERDVHVTVSELETLVRHLAASVADAAVAYANHRDEELRRRTVQHFGFIAHELRNALGSAVMAHSLLAQRGTIPEKGAGQALGRSLKRLSRLIDDSLIGSRLELAADLQCDVVDIAPFLRDLVDESSADAESKELTLHVEGEGQVRADRRVLWSALSNLIRNAIKFSASEHVVHVRAKHADGRVVFEVEDACGGLPEGTAEQLFAPHVQVGADRSGFGLGLAIAKLAATAHDGEIRVHDFPGRGCVFVIDLPALS
jgi:hypothetical protein